MRTSPSRLAKRRIVTQQLLTFRLRQEVFAIPIQAVQKVIPLGQVFGGSGLGIRLTRYQDQDISILDVDRRIFGDTPHQNLLPEATPPGDTQPHASIAIGKARSETMGKVRSETEQHYLLLLQTQQELIGIPLDAQPALCRVPESAFTRLPPTFAAEGNIRCISALIVLADDRPPLFLLNLLQLVQSPSLLPNSQAIER